MSDADKAYRAIEDDPLAWLEVAEGALLSANVIWGAYCLILPRSQTEPGVREARLAYTHSIMLLTGIAFENLFKGIAVSKGQEGWRGLRERGGHGISQYAPKITAISDAEADLLERVEEYLFWVSRYPIPMNARIYAKGLHLRSIRSDDQMKISRLFSRLKQELLAVRPQDS